LTDGLDFNEFLEKSQEIFSNWFTKKDDLDLAVKNFFSVYGRKGVLIENKFLTYISILENYYNLRNKIQKNLKDILMSQLKVSKLASKFGDIDLYAIKLKTTRNYHAHLEIKNEKKSFTSNEIMKTNIILEYVIREIFLKEVGLELNIESSKHINKITT